MGQSDGVASSSAPALLSQLGALQFARVADNEELFGSVRTAK
jgi:hypothetical protein